MLYTVSWGKRFFYYAELVVAVRLTDLLGVNLRCDRLSENRHSKTSKLHSHGVDVVSRLIECQPRSF
jgi:hypothetical protein